MAEAGDRRTALIFFGAVQLVLGLICAALVLFVVAGAELVQYARTARAGVTSAIVVYGVAAIYFVSAGIGSIRARRWARSLSVVVSAIWLAAGTVATVMIVLVIPRVLRGMPQPTVAPGCSIPLVFFAAIALPLILFLFYRSEGVRRTCETLDTKHRWTERAPLPVLGMAVIMAFAAITLMANVGNPMIAAFGQTLTGAPASLAMFAIAVLCAIIAVQVYRLRESGWWMLLLLQISGLAWGVAEIMRGDYSREVARRGPAEIYADPLFIGAMLTTWLAHFAFLLYLRRYFALAVAPRTRRND